MPFEDTQMFYINQHQFSNKTQSINHANLESLIKRIDGCKKSWKIIYKKIRWKYCLWVFNVYNMDIMDDIDNKRDVYGVEDCIEDVCESLRATHR